MEIYVILAFLIFILGALFFVYKKGAKNKENSIKSDLLDDEVDKLKRQNEIAPVVDYDDVSNIVQKYDTNK